MIDYEVNREAIERIKEIDNKLDKEKDGNVRTKLMFEQMLRGLYINTFN